MVIVVDLPSMDVTGINFVDVEYYYSYRYGSSLLVSRIDDMMHLLQYVA